MAIYNLDKKSKYNFGVIEKLPKSKLYQLDIGVKKGDIFESYAQNKDKKKLEMFAKKNDIRIFSNYQDLYESKKKGDKE